MVPLFLPQLACLALLVATWWNGDRPIIATAVVVLGVSVQYFAPTLSPLWLAALLLNVATAIYLAIRLKIG